jgi:hypothetical protein
MVKSRKRVTHLGHRGPILLPQYLRELLRCLSHLFWMMTKPTFTDLSMAPRKALNGSYRMFRGDEKL